MPEVSLAQSAAEKKQVPKWHTWKLLSLPLFVFLREVKGLLLEQDDVQLPSHKTNDQIESHTQLLLCSLIIRCRKFT